MAFAILAIAIFFAKIASTVEQDCSLSPERKGVGQCVNILKCPHALGNLQNGIRPTPCHSSKDPKAVCCPKGKSISESKCEEYIKILYRKTRNGRKLILADKNGPRRTTTMKPSTSTASPEPETDPFCPLITTNRISGGRKVKRNEYPHQAELGYGNGKDFAWRCGGVLVSERFLLSAAHCVKTKFGPPKKVLLGDRFLSTKENSERMIVDVESSFVHPKYLEGLFYNDLAVIKLSKAVPFSKAVRPVCLGQPEFRLDRRHEVTVTGFGQLGALDPASEVMQSVDLTKFDRDECSKNLTEDANTKARLPHGILPSQFCAGDKLGIKDTCHGDSGGPAVVTMNNIPCIFYLMGITSFGSTFCGLQQPGVYTNVLHYLEWIEDIVWPEEKTNHTLAPMANSTAATTTTVQPNTGTTRKTTRGPYFLADSTKAATTTTPSTTSHPTQSTSKATAIVTTTRSSSTTAQSLPSTTSWINQFFKNSNLPIGYPGIGKMISGVQIMRFLRD